MEASAQEKQRIGSVLAEVRPCVVRTCVDYVTSALLTPLQPLLLYRVL